MDTITAPPQTTCAKCAAPTVLGNSMCQECLCEGVRTEALDAIERVVKAIKSGEPFQASVSLWSATHTNVRGAWVTNKQISQIK